MILKNNLALSEHYLSKIQTLIGSNIINVLSRQMNIQIEKEPFTNRFSCKELVIFFQKKGKYFIMKLWSSYRFNEILGDELVNFYVLIEDIEITNDISSVLRLFEDYNNIFLPKEYYKTPFLVKEINIYGENRLRKWDKERITDYFSTIPEVNVPQQVFDYLFTTNYLVFENDENEQIVCGSNRNNVFFEITNNTETLFANDFYSMDELIMGIGIEYKEDWDEWLRKEEESNKTNKLRTKLQYHFSRNNINKFDDIKYGNYKMFFN